MKANTLVMSAIAAIAVGVSIATFSGCAIDRTTTVTSTTNAVTGTITETTNVVVTVDTNNLALDAAGLQALVASGVGITLQVDPSTLPYFQDAKTALDGILNGSNPNTPAQVMALLGNNGNAVIAANIAPVITLASSLEQQWLARYGASVAGQITLALAKAEDNGLAAALAGK